MMEEGLKERLMQMYLRYPTAYYLTHKKKETGKEEKQKEGGQKKRDRKEKSSQLSPEVCPRVQENCATSLVVRVPLGQEKPSRRKNE